MHRLGWLGALVMLAACAAFDTEVEDGEPKPGPDGGPVTSSSSGGQPEAGITEDGGPDAPITADPPACSGDDVFFGSNALATQPIHATLQSELVAFAVTASANGRGRCLNVYFNLVILGATKRTFAAVYATTLDGPGALLASGAFEGEIQAGWKQFALDAAVDVKTGTELWVAVGVPAGAVTVRYQEDCQDNDRIMRSTTLSPDAVKPPADFGVPSGTLPKCGLLAYLTP